MLALFIIAFPFGSSFAEEAFNEANLSGTPRESQGIPMLSPEESLKTFQLPPGYRVEIVAAEPPIQ
jgi:hypothetical protein